MNKLKLLAVFSLFLVLQSCVKDIIQDEYVAAPANTAVLVYIVADANGLSDNAVYDVNEMVSYMSSDPLDSCRLIVYRDYDGESTPRLFEISQNESGGVYTYLETYEDQDSSTPEVLAKVLNDFFSHVNVDNYRLVLWSHGSGWQVEASASSSKAVLLDNGNRMNIDDLKATLPSGKFDCILFDACLMGNVEVAYALKDKCNYMIASPSEVPGNGMPYDTILDGFFKGGVEGYSDVVDKFFEEYELTSDYAWGLSALYDMSKIDTLAARFRDVVRDKDVDSVNSDEIQEFSPQKDFYLYDLLSYVQTLSEDTDDLEQALSDFVVYKRYRVDEDNDTYGYGLDDSIWNRAYTVTDFCGTSCFIPFSSSSLTKDYKLTDWYLATYGAVQQ